MQARTCIELEMLLKPKGELVPSNVMRAAAELERARGDLQRSEAVLVLSKTPGSRASSAAVN